MKKLGFTLIELIAVMAALAVIMGFSATMLIQLFDFQRNNNEYSYKIRAADRLANDFRSDVRRYRKPEFPNDAEILLRWNTELETIEYTSKPGEFPGQLYVVRTVQNEEQQARSEIYRLPDRSVFAFCDGKDDDAGFVALSLWMTPQGTEIPDLADLNPFGRTLPPSLEQRIAPKYAGNWRTIVVKY